MFTGYRYAGLQFYQECYCGNSSFEKFGKFNSGCNLPCTGDNNQKCGGRERNSVYEIGTVLQIECIFF